MIDIPLGILMTLIVFIIFLTALYFIFGSPQCDSLANQTAYSIKLAVDTVASDSFPTWEGSDVPTDSDYTYYSTASIRLCQEQGTTFWDSFFGSPPEYQIYHEVFPEGGWSWNEAYPWSGGAAGTLKFWGAMRIGIGAWKIGSSLYKKASIVGIGSEAIKGVYSKAKKTITEAQLKDLLETLAAKHSDEAADIITSAAKRPGEVLAELHKLYEADEIYQTMKNLGYITDEVDEAGRFILKNEPIPMTIAVRHADGSITDESLYVLRKSDGTIEDISTVKKSGYVDYKLSPKEIYQNYYDSVSDSQKEYLEKHFTWKPSTVEKIKNLPGEIKGTSWYKSNFQPIVNKIKSYIKRVGTAGFDVDVVEIDGNGIIFGVEKLLTDPDSSDFWYKQIIGDTTVADKIKKTLKLGTTESITKDHVAKYLSMVSDSFNGYVFIPKELTWRINREAINIFGTNLKNGVELTDEGLKVALKNFADTEAPDLVENLAGGDVTKLYSMIDDVVDNEISPHMSNFVASGDTTAFTRDAFVSHMESTAAMLQDGNEQGLKELGLMMGTIEQNKNTLPVSFKSAVLEGAKRDIKKAVYLDVTAIANPGSWYAQGFFASRTLEGCQGNSICTLAKNNLEAPLYLDEAAEKFDIKLWRPVNPLQQVAGLQALIMHVPTNPRFYVVSPCFAYAKVWKTEYEGTDTIFILPEKMETEGASNYCYADSDLINQYTIVWAVTDLLDFMPWSSFLGVLKLAKPVTQVVDKIVGTADPATLLQGILESAISWPGYPWQPLGYQEMVEAQQNAPQVLER